MGYMWCIKQLSALFMEHSNFLLTIGFWGLVMCGCLIQGQGRSTVAMWGEGGVAACCAIA